MRALLPSLLLMLGLGWAAETASPSVVADRGIVAMRESFEHPAAIIDAAIAFSEARKLYQATSDTERVCEMQAYIFWCKKRMNLDDLKAYIGQKDQEKLAKALAAVDAVAAQPVPAAEAQAYFDRASAFAGKYPDRHLEIAVRYFEVAERFAGTDVSLKAQRISLDEQQKHLATLSTTEPAATAKPGFPAPWQHADIGSVGATGSASFADGVFTVAGSGGDMWDASDRGHLVWQPLVGDGSISARLTSFAGVDPYSKAGLTIRADTSDSAIAAMIEQEPAGTSEFQWRAATAGPCSHTPGPGGVPGWMKLTRLGQSLISSYSSDGLNWTVIGAQPLTLPANAVVGMAVTARHDGQLAKATYSDLRIAPIEKLPAPWQQADLGKVAFAGGAVYDGRTLTVTSSGNDIWLGADTCHFAWRPLVGDGSLTARITGMIKNDDWTKVGLMVRADPSPSAAHLFLCVIPKDNHHAIEVRPSDGAETSYTGASPGGAPLWLRVQRTGDEVTASVSQDGATWTVAGSARIPLPRTACIGFAATAHHDGQLTAASFTDIDPPLAPATGAGAHARAAQPDAEAVRAAVERLRQAMKADYAKTQKAQRRALSARLLAQARATPADPLMRWALVSEATDVAIAGGDPLGACAAIDASADWFTGVDAAAAKKAALSRTGGALSSALAKLIDAPKDAEASATVGKHLCFELGRWDEGARLIAAGSDKDLKRAAEMDLAAPNDPSQQAEVADAWRKTGTKLSGAAKNGPLARAQWWYLRAIPQLAGMTQEIATKRLAEVADALPDDRLDPRAASKKRWEAIKAKPVTIKGDQDRMDTGVVLAPGQTAIVFPLPGDIWYAAGDTSDAHGAAARLNGFAVGEMVWAIDNGARDSIWGTPIVGAGHLMLGANRASNGGKGGSIPVKIVVADDD